MTSDKPVSTEKEPGWLLGTIIRRARGQRSIRRMAARADISEARWRQIEQGYQDVGGGIRREVNPRDETLIAMAQAVGLDPVELFAQIGRPWDDQIATDIDPEVRANDLIDQIPGIGPRERDDLKKYLRFLRTNID
jgi:transcriptional regulator with XRE-family HTH domain